MNSKRKAGGSAAVGAVERLSPTVLRLTLSGYIDTASGRQFAMQLGASFGTSNQQHLFVDVEHLERYDSDVRKVFTETLVRHLSQIASIRVLATSRIVKMGAAVANIATGGRMEMVKDRRTLDAALRAVLENEPRSTSSSKSGG